MYRHTLTSFGDACGAAALVGVALCCPSAPTPWSAAISFGVGVICDSFFLQLKFVLALPTVCMHHGPPLRTHSAIRSHFGTLGSMIDPLIDRSWKRRGPTDINFGITGSLLYTVFGALAPLARPRWLISTVFSCPHPVHARYHALDSNALTNRWFLFHRRAYTGGNLQ